MNLVKTFSFHFAVYRIGFVVNEAPEKVNQVCEKCVMNDEWYDSAKSNFPMKTGIC